MRVAPPGEDGGVLIFFALACGITWVLATPAALAWSQHRAPPAYAVACAGLSAFGPLFATLLVAGPRGQLRQVFGRWKTHPGWIALALVAPAAVHLVATALLVATGGTPDAWFHPPSAPEQWAALVVFPLGEEPGWRGFAHPRMVRRFGLVKGSLLLGGVWGLWHLAYSVTPQASGFDGVTFAMTMAELPLYSVLLAWVFERSGRSLAVAIAFHAGAHLDHIELAPRAGPTLPLLHLAVVAALALAAGWSMRARARLPFSN